MEESACRQERERWVEEGETKQEEGEEEEGRLIIVQTRRLSENGWAELRRRKIVTAQHLWELTSQLRLQPKYHQFKTTFETCYA